MLLFRGFWPGAGGGVVACLRVVGVKRAGLRGGGLFELELGGFGGELAHALDEAS